MVVRRLHNHHQLRVLRTLMLHLQWEEWTARQKHGVSCVVFAVQYVRASSARTSLSLCGNSKPQSNACRPSEAIVDRRCGSTMIRASVHSHGCALHTLRVSSFYSERTFHGMMVVWCEQPLCEISKEPPRKMVRTGSDACALNTDETAAQLLSSLEMFAKGGGGFKLDLTRPAASRAQRCPRSPISAVQSREAAFEPSILWLGERIALRTGTGINGTVFRRRCTPPAHVASRGEPWRDYPTRYSNGRPTPR